MVECYLVPGEKYKLALFESVSYLDDPRIPLVYDAQVSIVHNGDTAKLFNAIVDRTDTSMGYNYMSNRRIPFDYDSDFFLYIKDKTGRILTSKCKLLKPIIPQSIRYQKNENDRAYVNIQIPPETTDRYYRIFANANTLSWNTIKWEQREFVEAGKSKELYSPLVFEKGDSVLVTFATMEKSYFDFLNSMNQASVSSIDPFSQASKVTSNIVGGEGIFASYNYVRQKVKIE